MMYDYYIVVGGMKYLTFPLDDNQCRHVFMYATESHIIHIPYKLEGPGSSERDIEEFKKRIIEVERLYYDNFNKGCMLLSYHLLSN